MTVGSQLVSPSEIFTGPRDGICVYGPAEIATSSNELFKAGDYYWTGVGSCSLTGRYVTIGCGSLRLGL